MTRPSCITAVKRTLLAALTVASATSFAADEPLPTSVADLRYGVTLYEYYQANYFTALSELMVAEARGGIQGHKDNPELIAGSIGLAFGMEERAGTTFAKLLDQGRPQVVRDTAWFYLGKLQYHQGDWLGAEQSFSQISAEVDKRLKRELASMRVQVLLRTNDFKGARQLVDGLENLGNWAELINYNMGVSFGREGDAVAAQKYLAEVTSTELNANPIEQKLQRALRDRAYTASGYVHIQQGEYDAAVAQFQKVRLTGPYSDRALLGLGWAEVSRKNYDKALAPWQTLSEGSLQQSPVLESLLAIPYAYEQLDADVAALSAYESAELIFMRELEKIAGLREALADQFLLNSIRSAASNQNQSWFTLDENVALQPEIAYLTEIFARNDFQTKVQSVRDLLFLQATLKQWAEKQGVYTDLLVLRGQVREQKLANMKSTGLLTQEAELREQAAKLSAWVTAVEKDRDYLALITDEEMLDNLEIVDTAIENVAGMTASGEDMSEELRQLKFYRGIISWQAQDKFSENLWTQKRNLAELNAELEKLTQTQKSLQKAIDEAPEILPYQQRMSALDQRLAAETVAIEQQLAAEEKALRAQVLKALDEQQIRVKNYLARARLSVARLYDERLKQ
ncbi:hypothetical protein R50072_00630 [Simiduia litorea]|uniref:tetratricopeptide repeat protein n=1 Tax=Simiduia litorea TaxID=1435348 RepID=UPI0036F3BFCF